MAKIKITGLKELQEALKRNVTLDDVRETVYDHGKQMQFRMQKKAVFSKGYSTGATKKSISLEMKDAGLTAEVGPETEYSPYVEYGTRFMEAQPFISPAYEEQKEMFLKDMRRLVK